MRRPARAADPVIGPVITVAVLGVLRSAVRQVGAWLMDAVDPALVDPVAFGSSSARELAFDETEWRRRADSPSFMAWRAGEPLGLVSVWTGARSPDR